MFVELGEQVEQQRPAGLRERQIAQFIEDHQIEVHELMSQSPGLAGSLLLLQRID